MFPAFVPALMTAFGALQQYEGAMEAGEAAAENGRLRRAAAEFKAQNARIAAGQAIAVAQRDAEEQRRQGRYVGSRALALIAASGGGASDPTVVRILSNTAGEASYRASVALYRGLDQARSLRMQATADEYEGYMAEQAGLDTQVAYERKATGALFSAAGSLFTSYGQGGPGAAPDYQDAWSTQGAYP